MVNVFMLSKVDLKLPYGDYDLTNYFDLICNLHLGVSLFVYPSSDVVAFCPLVLSFEKTGDVFQFFCMLLTYGDFF